MTLGKAEGVRKEGTGAQCGNRKDRGEERLRLDAGTLMVGQSEWGKKDTGSLQDRFIHCWVAPALLRDQ